MSNAVFAEIANWRLEAKLEDNQRYFYHTADIDRLEDGSRCYVIGRKGTGKTAISEYLIQHSSAQRFSQKLTFKNFPFNDLYALDNSRFNAPNQYITLWKYLIYSCVAKMMATNENIAWEIREKLLAVYDADPVRALAPTISKWTAGNLDFKILGSGIARSRTETNFPNDKPWVERMEILEEIIIKHLDDSEYLIIFDELDEDYKDITAREAHVHYGCLLTSLFKTVQDIKAIFQQPRFNLFPIVFLRDDIYDIMKDSDRTKWSDLVISLDWNTPKLKNLLAFRISRAINASEDPQEFDSAWNAIFEPRPVQYGDRQSKRISIFEYITRSTCLRPRDYIRYLSVCSESATAEGSNKVSPALVQRVDKAFSNYMRSEMEDEIHGVLPEISAILDIIAHLRRQEFHAEDFLHSYRREVGRGLLPDRNSETVLKILFHFSVIGNHPKQRNSQVFRYLNKEARLNLNESLCVHRGLFKALQIL